MKSNKIVKMFSNFEYRPLIPLAIVLGISLLIKVALIHQTAIINDDGIRYINSAHELFQGNVAAAFSHEKMLGYVFLLGLTHLVVPDWFLAGKVLSSVAMFLTTIPLYCITQEIFNRRAAILASLAFIVVPEINDICASIVKDPVFLFLIVMSLWIVLYAHKSSRWIFFFAAGLLSCISIMVRPEGLFFFLVLVLFLIASAIFVPMTRHFKLRCLAAFCGLPFGAIILLTILFVSGMIPLDPFVNGYIKFAHYFQTDFSRIYMDIYQHLGAVENNFSGGQWSNDFFEHARHYIFLIYLVGMVQVFCSTLFPVFVVPLLWGAIPRKSWNSQVFLLLSVIGSFLLLDYFFLLSRNFLSHRYMLVPVTLSFVLIGNGLDRMIQSLRNRHYRKTVLFTMILLCVLLPLGKSFVNISHEGKEIKAAGDWLRKNRDVSHARMIVNDERIAFYSGLLRGDYDTFKSSGVKPLEKKALNNDCEIIVVYGRKGAVNKNSVFSSFTFTKEFTGRKKVAVIYERKKQDV